MYFSVLSAGVNLDSLTSLLEFQQAQIILEQVRVQISNYNWSFTLCLVSWYLDPSASKASVTNGHKLINLHTSINPSLYSIDSHFTAV